MNHSPPGELHRPPATCRGPERNANYVRVVNSFVNGPSVLRRRKAERLVQDGRAAWCAVDQIKMLPTAANLAAARATAAEYNAVRNGFEWQPRGSAGATVMQATKGPAR
jgi:hypothetical protein